MQYPEGIRELEYQPGFAIRGLHYDVSKGLLLKLDSFLQIQLGSVYRGLTPLSDEEVLKLYKSRTIPLAYVESGRSAVSKYNIKYFCSSTKRYEDESNFLVWSFKCDVHYIMNNYPFPL